MTTILVIEDDWTVRESIQSLLEIEGFQTLEAADGAVGVQLAQNYLPDLVLCDVQMLGMDGYQVLDTLRESPRTATIPFIFLTARGTKADMRQGMTSGADDYLTKPLIVEELLEAIASRLEKQAAFRNHSQQELDGLRSRIAAALPAEFGSPLSNIMSNAILLRHHHGMLQPDEMPKIAASIYSSAEHLQKLVQDFLLYAELETTANNPEKIKSLRKRITYYPKGIISGIAKQVAQQFKREYDLQLDLQNRFVAISDFSLNKLLEEVISDAFKFSVAGKIVSVVSYVEGEQLIIAVSDRGQAIDPEQIARLGGYMQSENNLPEKRGMGLGLSIAKRLIELHNGSLHIDSKPGEMTTVTAILPTALHG